MYEEDEPGYELRCDGLWCSCSKMRVKREAERAEIRWKLWLREKAVAVWARLMEEMMKTGEIMGTVRSEC